MVNFYIFSPNFIQFFYSFGQLSFFLQFSYNDFDQVSEFWFGKDLNLIGKLNLILEIRNVSLLSSNQKIKLQMQNYFVYSYLYFTKSC